MEHLYIVEAVRSQQTHAVWLCFPVCRRMTARPVCSSHMATSLHSTAYHHFLVGTLGIFRACRRHMLRLPSLPSCRQSSLLPAASCSPGRMFLPSVHPPGTLATSLTLTSLGMSQSTCGLSCNPKVSTQHTHYWCRCEPSEQDADMYL